jgi:cytochrome c
MVGRRTGSMGMARRWPKAARETSGALFAAAFLGLAAPAPAGELSDQQARAFFNDEGCNACHAVDQLHLAPSFRTISQRYAGAPSDTVDDLAQKIIHGGAGNWGVVPMISNPKITAAEARAIAAWIILLGNRSIDNGPPVK